MCLRQGEESSSSAHPALARRHWLAPFSTRHRRRRPGPTDPRPVRRTRPTRAHRCPVVGRRPDRPQLGGDSVRGFRTPGTGGGRLSNADARRPPGRPADRRHFRPPPIVRRAVLSGPGKHLVLVVDDAHRLDEASATLIFQLVSSGDAAALIAVRSAAPMPDGVRALWAGLVGASTCNRSTASTPLSSPAISSPVSDGDLAGGPDGTQGREGKRRSVTRASGSMGREDVGRIVLEGVCGACVGSRLSDPASPSSSTNAGRVSRSEMTTLEMVAFADSVPLSVLTRLTPGCSISSLQRQGLITVK